jgi:hypothetical protein
VYCTGGFGLKPASSKYSSSHFPANACSRNEAITPCARSKATASRFFKTEPAALVAHVHLLQIALDCVHAHRWLLLILPEAA